MPLCVLVNIPGKKKSLNKRFVETPAFAKILNYSVGCSVVQGQVERCGRCCAGFSLPLAAFAGQELEKSEKKLRKAINDEKALQYQLKQLTRKERTHRLCTRGGMLESFLQEPERLTDDDVMLLLKLIFHRQDTQELLKKLLEREKPETP